MDQGSEDKLCANPANLLEDGFGPNPRFWCLLAEEDGLAAGIALYYVTYSTWTSPHGIYLEDLYVAPAFRRRGVARALMDRLVAMARDSGWRRINWLVLRDNEPAIRFYESIGAKTSNDDVLMMRLHL